MTTFDHGDFDLNDDNHGSVNPYDIPINADPDELVEGITSLQAIDKDLKAAAATLTVGAARFLVDYYYQMQRNRIRAGHQALKAGEAEEPGIIAKWALSNSHRLEANIQQVLNIYSNGRPLGRWSRSVCGIGPVLASGLLAHIDFEPWHCTRERPHCTERQPHPECGRLPLYTAGRVWRFAGLDPTLPRMAKGQKRPWNARLKTLCWKVAESFVKVSSNFRDIYGRYYLVRKEFEWSNNLAGALVEQAQRALTEKEYRTTTDAYHWYSGRVTVAAARQYLEELVTVAAARKLLPPKQRASIPSPTVMLVGIGQGQQMLPPAHIQARAERWTVKLFLAHYHHVGYEIRYGVPPPRPYVLTHLGHVDFIAPPNWPMP
jgi:hypothetical protein